MEKSAVITSPESTRKSLVELYSNFEGSSLEEQASSMLEAFNKIMRQELSVRELAFYIAQAKSEQLQKSQGYSTAEFFAVFILNKLAPSTTLFDKSC
jgi:hypothetical protein